MTTHHVRGRISVGDGPDDMQDVAVTTEEIEQTFRRAFEEMESEYRRGAMALREFLDSFTSRAIDIATDAIFDSIFLDHVPPGQGRSQGARRVPRSRRRRARLLQRRARRIERINRRR